MNYFEFELNGEVLRFRLKSSDAIAIEKAFKMPLLDFIQDYSIINIVTLLRYLRMSEVPNFSLNQATDLFDELVNAGYVLEKIVFEIIFEALVVSGILSKQDLDDIKTKAEKETEELDPKND